MISDLHFGGYVTRTDDLRAFLQRLAPTRRLILNGDTMDGQAVRLPFAEVLACDRLAELARDHLNTIHALKREGETIDQADARLLGSGGPDALFGTKVTLVRGNHDPKPEEWASVVGLDHCDVADEVVVESGGKKFLVIHGHQYDPFCAHDHWWERVVIGMGRLAGRVNATAARSIKSWLQKNRTRVLVRDGALARCWADKLNGVICGHTHWSERLDSSLHKAAYVNTGCWCSNAAPCWAEIEDGELRLMTWQGGEAKRLPSVKGYAT
jgi:UDP-2,3-diacylglucosamine pyrophosphatase LpxH